MNYDNDETLLLYYYNDGLSKAERAKVADALAADESLAKRYTRISEALGRLPDEPATALASDQLQRFHDTIEKAANRTASAEQRRPRQTYIWSFLLGAMATAAIVAAIGFSTLLNPGTTETGLPQSVDLTPAVYSTPSNNPDALRRGLQVYFRDSRTDLARLSTETDAERTAMIMSLIEQNRRYEKLASQNASPELARVLRAFEPILLRLAADDISAEDSELLRSKLGFELNVMLTKLTQEASENTQSTKQETRT